MKNYFSLLILCMLALGNAPAQVGFGHAQKFNNDWKFALTDDSLAIEPKYKDAKWRAVELPHDWSIEGL